MGKVFNEEIVKILYDKYLRKSNKNQQQEKGANGDSAAVVTEEFQTANKSSADVLKKGGSYVVVLDKQSLNNLQKHIGSLKQESLTQSNEICCPEKDIQYWINPKPFRIQSSMSSPCMQTENGKVFTFDSAPESIKTVGLLTDANEQRSENSETSFDVHSTPLIFGPFADEPIAAILDRLSYCIKLLLKH